MKDFVIVVVNNRIQFDAILRSGEFEFKARPKCIIANSWGSYDRLRGMENFTIIFGDRWSKNMLPEWRHEFMLILKSRRNVEVLHSKW